MREASFVYFHFTLFSHYLKFGKCVISSYVCRALIGQSQVRGVLKWQVQYITLCNCSLGWGSTGLITNDSPKHVNKRSALTCRQPDTGDLMVTPAATWQLCAITGPDAVNAGGMHHVCSLNMTLI